MQTNNAIPEGTYNAIPGAPNYDGSVWGPSSKPWKVTRLVDRGAGYVYRFRAEGTNECFHPSHPDRCFAWDVPNLDCASYDLSAVAH